MTRKLHQLTKSVFFLPPDGTTDRPVLGYITGEDKTLMIDAGNSAAHAEEMKQQLVKEQLMLPRLIVLTHWHWDHIFGLNAWKSLSVAHQKTYEAMFPLTRYGWSDDELDQRVKEGTEIEFCATMIKKEFGDKRGIAIKLPDITFTGHLCMSLGGIGAEVHYVGGDHSDDSCIIFIPEEKVLFLGDCLYANMYAPSYQYTATKLMPLIQKLESFDADYFLLSHQMPMQKEEFLAYTALLKQVCRLTEEHKGSEPSIRAALENANQRRLNDLEEEVLFYFVAGYLP